MADPTSHVESAPNRGLDLGPRSMERPTDHGSTLIGGLETVEPARVDGGGLVHVPGTEWSLDWWIGGDDRWYLPAREPSVRQRRIGYGPVIETSVRIPSGDAVHTVYPVVAAGGTMTVIEVENQSPVPVALAMAIRPYGVDGRVAAPGPSIELSGGSAGDLIEIDGRPGLLLPRAPSSFGRSARVDLLTVVEAGRDPGEADVGSSGDGASDRGPTTNGVVLYPLPHRTTLRFAIPDPTVAAAPSARSIRVGSLPDADSSSRGWTTVVEQGGRFEFPDSGVTELVGSARSRLLLAAPTLARSLAEVDPTAGPVLRGLVAGGHDAEVRAGLAGLARSFPTALAHGPHAGAAVVGAVADAVETLNEPGPVEELLESVAQLTHLVERADDAEASTVARAGLARLLRAVGQPEAAAGLENETGGGRRRWFRRSKAAPTSTVTASSTPAPDVEAETETEPEIDVDLRSGADDAPDLVALTELVEGAAPARRWGDDDAVAAAEFLLAAREFLIRTDPGRPGQVELLPGFPTAWRGGTVEVHRAPTPYGRVSFAIRWHGFRPALLWEVEPRPGMSAAPTLVCPALDPDWSTVDSTGETLLAGLGEELPPAPEPGDSFS